MTGGDGRKHRTTGPLCSRRLTAERPRLSAAVSDRPPWEGSAGHCAPPAPRPPGLLDPAPLRLAGGSAFGKSPAEWWPRSWDMVRGGRHVRAQRVTPQRVCRLGVEAWTPPVTPPASPGPTGVVLAPGLSPSHPTGPRSPGHWLGGRAPPASCVFFGELYYSWQGNFPEGHRKPNSAWSQSAKRSEQSTVSCLQPEQAGGSPAWVRFPEQGAGSHLARLPQPRAPFSSKYGPARPTGNPRATVEAGTTPGETVGCRT